jgi:hypothetical protein
MDKLSIGALTIGGNTLALMQNPDNDQHDIAVVLTSTGTTASIQDTVSGNPIEVASVRASKREQSEQGLGVANAEGSACPHCLHAVIEIDHYAERLFGCIECQSL